MMWPVATIACLIDSSEALASTVTVLAATSTFTEASDSTVLMALVIVSAQPEQTMEGTLSSIAIIKRDLVDDSIDSCFILT
jgi:hypothetical protein